MKKLSLLALVGSLMSVSAFGNQMYGSDSMNKSDTSSSTTTKDTQQRMEDGSRVKTKETKSTTTEPSSSDNTIKKRTERTETKTGY